MDYAQLRRDQERAVREAAASFPPEFGLRAFPRRRFFVDVTQSFFSTRDGVQLYVYERHADGLSSAFSRDTPERLRREVTP
jgi:hypothetical protein